MKDMESARLTSYIYITFKKRRVPLCTSSSFGGSGPYVQGLLLPKLNEVLWGMLSYLKAM